jgi:hypothetical protein
MCAQVACHISWKAFDNGYNFALDLAFIGGLHKKLWASKVAEIPIIGLSPFFLNLDMGVPEKMTFECNPCGKPQRIL